MSTLVTERPDGSIRVQTVNEDTEVTKQSFKDECDINLILRSYNSTGVIRHLNRAKALFLDVSSVPDFAGAISEVRQAEAEFMKLPAKVRAVFDHDPAKFLDAAHDPAKRDLLEAAGLIPAEKPGDVVEAATEAPANPEP